jgi:hypothetical protein
MTNLKLTDEPCNSREWGLLHENSARKAYTRIECHNHDHKLKLITKGFIISEEVPYLGASVDDIQTCDCANACPNCVVEYKCPWKHRDIHPKEAFLTKEIGGVRGEGCLYTLKPTSKYFYRVQLQMFVTQLRCCIFVVWTKKGIFSTRITYDEEFMQNVCKKLKLFWVGHVVPHLIRKCQPVQGN